MYYTSEESNGFDEIEYILNDKFGKQPKTTYKYLDLNSQYTKDSLKDNYAWFSDPRTLNDPFDKPLFVAYYRLNQDRELFKNYHRTHLEWLHNVRNSDEIEKIVLKLEEEHFSEPKSIQSLADFDFQQSCQQDRMSAEMGLFSTCLEKDNILLWSHYANKHTGACLGINTLEMLNLHYPNVGVVPISYNEHPIIDPFDEHNNKLSNDNYINILGTKAPCWAYEKEYRFISCDIGNERKRTFGNSIESLILGCNISDTNRENVIDAIKVINPQAKIYQAQKVKFKFALQILQLSI